MKILDVCDIHIKIVVLGSDEMNGIIDDTSASKMPPPPPHAAESDEKSNAVEICASR